jgi:hypothetical protein
MTKPVVTIIAEAAFVHEGRSVIRGDRLDMSRDDALDLQALALARIVPKEDVEVVTVVGTAEEQPKPRRTASRNRYLRRDARRDEGTGT